MFIAIKVLPAYLSTLPGGSLALLVEVEIMLLSKLR
jgi:hypothetical protein